ncbi:hypothetical protein BT63DRAFT_451903 [Microthyrium microscopicum]|uniref:Uncharacterized protein n=1 Tax=Microthyrium microscopicum TaxID=703497 RepID=A0A6A6UR22_9PEZI|nr:hypothetical protein BT63DRAFT_451903 [Microthyrium microscopicum]
MRRDRRDVGRYKSIARLDIDEQRDTWSREVAKRSVKHSEQMKLLKDIAKAYPEVTGGILRALRARIKVQATKGYQYNRRQPPQERRRGPPLLATTHIPGRQSRTKDLEDTFTKLFASLVRDDSNPALIQSLEITLWPIETPYKITRYHTDIWRRAFEKMPSPARISFQEFLNIMRTTTVYHQQIFYEITLLLCLLPNLKALRIKSPGAALENNHSEIGFEETFRDLRPVLDKLIIFQVSPRVLDWNNIQHPMRVFGPFVNNPNLEHLSYSDYRDIKEFNFPGTNDQIMNIPDRPPPAPASLPFSVPPRFHFPADPPDVPPHPYQDVVTTGDPPHMVPWNNRWWSNPLVPSAWGQHGGQNLQTIRLHGVPEIKTAQLQDLLSRPTTLKSFSWVCCNVTCEGSHQETHGAKAIVPLLANFTNTLQHLNISFSNYQPREQPMDRCKSTNALCGFNHRHPDPNLGRYTVTRACPPFCHYEMDSLKDFRVLEDITLSGNLLKCLHGTFEYPLTVMHSGGFPNDSLDLEDILPDSCKYLTISSCTSHCFYELRTFARQLARQRPTRTLYGIEGTQSSTPPSPQDGPISGDCPNLQWIDLQDTGTPSDWNLDIPALRQEFRRINQLLTQQLFKPGPPLAPTDPRVANTIPMRPNNPRWWPTQPTIEGRRHPDDEPNGQDDIDFDLELNEMNGEGPDLAKLAGYERRTVNGEYARPFGLRPWDRECPFYFNDFRWRWSFLMDPENLAPGPGN